MFVDGRLDFNLRPPATARALDAVEASIGFALPADARELYLTHDGQKAGDAPGLFLGSNFDPLDRALTNWRLWREFTKHDTEEFAVPGTGAAFTDASRAAVRQAFSNSQWFPISGDGSTGTAQLNIDMDPAPPGVRGQVIYSNNEDYDRFAWAPSVTAFLDRIVQLCRANRIVFNAEPESWGHVWGCANDNGRPLPLEISQSAWFAHTT
jgi:cell wall assembly regulator SMI1